MLCCVMNLHTVVVNSRAAQYYWGWYLFWNMQLNVHFDIRISCLSEAVSTDGKKKGLRLTWDPSISLSGMPISNRWKGNHICRKSPPECLEFLMKSCKASKAANWWFAQRESGGALQWLIIVAGLIQREWGEESNLHDRHSHTVERESPLPCHLLFSSSSKPSSSFSQSKLYLC